MEEIIEKNPVGRPRVFKSREELETKIEEYFKWCDERKIVYVDKDGEEHEVKKPRPYTISGLAAWLGVDRQTLLNYDERDEFFGTISRARKKCAAYAEEQLFEGNDRGAKFALINNYGWVDQQQIDINATATMEISPDQLDSLKVELLQLIKEAQAKNLLPPADVIDVESFPVLEQE